MSKILIIDDSDISANQISKQLVSQYFDVLRIDSRADSIQVIRDDIFKAVIVDAMLVNEQAFSICRSIKENFPQMPVFIVSPIYSIDAKIKTLQSGAEDYIAKPFNLDLFVTRLRYAIKTKDELDQLIARNKNSDLTLLTNNSMIFANTNIILIDDDIAEANYIKEILSGKIASLHIVETINELTENMISESEVIIASGYLVNHFGVEICSKIKNDPRFNEKSFMLLVEQDDETLLNESYKAGINEFATTPLNAEAFLIKLRRLLNITYFKKQLLGKLISELNLAIIDPLTGLYNRRHFDNKTTHLISKQQANNIPCALMIADIDKFKSVNDTYGHLIGDQVLIETSKRLKEIVSDIGSVYRFGGEEFVVLLENATLQQATNIAEKIRMRIAGTEFKITAKPYDIPVTISIGVTSLYKEDLKINNLIERADQALYQAKNSGRNKVCSISL
jgi:two-component system cell cycle response regulator